MVMSNLADRATKSYLIPIGDMSLTDRQAIRKDCDNQIVSAALRAAVKDDPDLLAVRDTLPNTDLGLAAQEAWLIAGAGVVATELQYFNPTLAVDRCVGFFGVATEMATPGVSRLRFTLGAASSQVRGTYQLEPLYTRLEAAGYFSEVVIFVRQELVRCMVMPRVAWAANTERLELYARTVEPIGTVVSLPSA